MVNLGNFTQYSGDFIVDFDYVRVSREVLRMAVLNILESSPENVWN